MDVNASLCSSLTPPCQILDGTGDMSELLESSIWKLAIHLTALEEQSSSRQGEETRACIVDIGRWVPLLVEKV